MSKAKTKKPPKWECKLIRREEASWPLIEATSSDYTGEPCVFVEAVSVDRTQGKRGIAALRKMAAKIVEAADWMEREIAELKKK